MKRNIFAVFTFGATALKGIGGLIAAALVMTTITPAFSVDDTRTIHGDVTYLQRVALPQHAYLIVQLVDVSNSDGPFPVVAEISSQPNGSVPIEFALPTDKANIEPVHKYALQARIAVGDILWFVSDERTPVSFDNLDNHYELVLGMVNQSTTTPQPISTTIAGHEWKVEDIFGNGIIDSSELTISVPANAEDKNADNFPRYRIAGSGGCNRYTSSLMIDEDRNLIYFDPPAMTFMACAEAISQQESRFIEMLDKAKSFTFDDLGRLILKDDNGNYVARLVPDL
ncbi:YbaY family lipoprotein [uncultured Bartonella sp.]|uniref:YbaY family lipoprotein n=1 Tax=uncultured Bartonella sp. TaxID=104108 RepID=UPI0026327C7E|nr:YbaY family lipoprotein [uncultured Bartonella sp.]